MAYVVLAFVRGAGRGQRELVVTDLGRLIDLAPAGVVYIVTPSGVPLSGGDKNRFLLIDRGSLDCHVERDALFAPVPAGGKTFSDNGLYRASGELIEQSCLFRERDRSEQVTRQRSELPADVVTSDEAVIYVGALVTHFGHMLTESIARFWYAIDCRPDLPVLVHGLGAMQARHVARFVTALGFPRERFIGPSRVMRFKEVHLPDPTVVLSCSIHERHVDLTRHAAARILDGRPLTRTQQPLYLSRARLPIQHRAMYGERQLIRHLRREGVRIVDPQELDFDEQVRLINEHEVIIGPMGSAHYSTLLALEPRHHVYLCHGALRDSVLIDLVTRNRAHYLQLAPSVPSLQKKRNNLLDVPLALSALRDLGVLSSRPKSPSSLTHA